MYALIYLVVCPHVGCFNNVSLIIHVLMVVKMKKLKELLGKECRKKKLTVNYKTAQDVCYELATSKSSKYKKWTIFNFLDRTLKVQNYTERCLPKTYSIKKGKFPWKQRKECSDVMRYQSSYVAVNTGQFPHK